MADSIKNYEEIRIPNTNGRNVMSIIFYEDYSQRYIRIKKVGASQDGVLSLIANGINLS